MWVSQEAGHGGVAGDLVIEEEAPVIAIWHSQFAIRQCEPVQDVVLHLLIVVHQGISLPLFCAVQSQLEHLEGKSCLAQLLLYYILIGSVEEIVVLK